MVDEIFPRHGGVKLTGQQANAEVLVNEGLYRVMTGAAFFTVENDSLTAPPGSEVDGQAHIIGGTPTGEWESFADDDIVFAVGAAAANGWRSITPFERCYAYDKADDHWLYWNGTSWVVEANVVSLTDNTGGTASDAINDVGASFNQTTLNNIHASLLAKINAILTILSNHGLMT